MEENSENQFKLDHMRRRIAAMSVAHEDDMSAANFQIATLHRQLEMMRQQCAALQAEVERLTPVVEPEEGEEADPDQVL